MSAQAVRRVATSAAGTGQTAADCHTPPPPRRSPALALFTHVGVSIPDSGAASDFLSDVLGFVICELLATDDGDRTLSVLLFRTNNGEDIAVFPGMDVRLH